MWVFDFFLWKTDAYDSPASARSSARSRSASTMANLRATCINDTYTRFFPYVLFLFFSLFCNTLGFFLFLSNSFRFANPCLACVSKASGPRSTISRLDLPSQPHSRDQRDSGPARCRSTNWKSSSSFCV